MEVPSRALPTLGSARTLIFVRALYQSCVVVGRSRQGDFPVGTCTAAWSFQSPKRPPPMPGITSSAPPPSRNQAGGCPLPAAAVVGDVPKAQSLLGRPTGKAAADQLAILRSGPGVVPCRLCSTSSLSQPGAASARPAAEHPWTSGGLQAPAQQEAPRSPAPECCRQPCSLSVCPQQKALLGARERGGKTAGRDGKLQ
eukprot:CAMPEP_0175672404 /NCGR_PEP_ID=MMETSP0097-20121207/20674_1 /TAXON_ID=311494 /ORGANISM="Alexandrium monilatum, Strain CCMP3105" /LENGTH=197 /DNA_ID=CAMNT_0016979041 /DNA_START=301 /DNA_END=892 /DNA_ORIENTATION=-